MIDPKKSYVRWLIRFLFLSIGFAVTIAGINYLIDPVWATGGNKLGDVNYAFNERVSKLYLFESEWMDKSRQPEVLILGSSKSTLLDQNLINGGNCFNFSFSGGRVEEFIELSEYLKRRGVCPKVVMVELSRFNFEEFPYAGSQFPDFVSNSDAPPLVIWQYLNTGNLEFSIKTLLGLRNFPRHYNSDFVVEVDSNAPRYHPATFRLEPPAMDASRAELFRELRLQFPESRFVGYVPPLSAWRVTSAMRSEGDMFFSPLLSVREQFSVVVDYTVPSDWSEAIENTYDGIHYFPVIMDQVAQRLDYICRTEHDLDPERLAPGLIVEIEGGDYVETFERRVLEFQRKTGYGLD